MNDREWVLLLCDVVDSTALTERLGDAGSLALWINHDSQARDLLACWRGREVDKTDGLFAIFDGVADALGFATAYHQALAAMDPPLRARAAIHRAAVLLRETPAADVARGAKPLDVDGIAKPLTARMCALALGGQTLVSETAAAALAAAPRLVALGHWRFKGVSEPMALFEPAAHPLGPPPDVEKAWRVTRDGKRWLPTREVPHSLPAERDGFVGRRPALAELAAAFADGTRLVTVLGVGGTGKTRLAQRHGWDALGGHPGGVWYCDLSQSVSLDGIVHAVAQGLQLPLGASDAVQQIGNAIASRGAVLVILDNFEQVARHAEATLGRWLAQAGAATFLVTSREVLGIGGERTMALPPLPEDDGAELFVRRARDAVADFSPGDDDRAVIAELVRLLDGLPLSIELAAARVRVMTPRAMLSRMGERFKLLATPGGRRDRQSTLRATLDWSWDLLSEAERAALAQLSVFEGGFTLEAAEAVLELSALDAAPWVVDVVQALVQKSWVRHASGRRFGILRTVQDYAAMALAVQGPQAVAQAAQRHSQYFAFISERAAISDRCADADNLVSACRRATTDGAAQVAVGALGNAWAVLRLTGPFGLALELADLAIRQLALDADGRARVEIAAASALDALGQGQAAHARLLATLSSMPTDSMMRARVPCVLGEIASNLGQLDEAADLLMQALRSAEVQADVETQCRAHNALGWLAYWRSESTQARTHYLQALELARELGDLRWEGGLLGNLGVLDHTLGHHAEALSYYERALLLAHETGDRRWEANARCNLGLVQHEMGRSDAAREHLASALASARHMGHRKLEGTVLCNLGHVCESLRDLPAARANYERAVEIASGSGDRRGEGVYRAHLGLLLARLGLAGEARSCLLAGAVHLRQSDDRAVLSLLCAKQALSEAVLGDAAAGLDALAEAEAHALHSPPEPASELAAALAAARAALQPV